MSRTELMEIGEHCSFCGQIDFLPFKCSCKSSFCSQHRLPEVHNCPNLTKQKKQIHNKSSNDEFDTSHLPSAKTLFPDRSNFKIELQTTKENPNTLKKTLIKNKNNNALLKLKNFFFENQNNKSNFKNTNKNPSKRMIEISKLKTQSKGDSKIPISERIYIWVQIIDEESSSTSSSNIDKTSLKKKHPIFINRCWPIGRALDFTAQELNLKNINNKTNDSSQKLFLFKHIDSIGNYDLNIENNFIKLNTSDRCSSLKDGDDIYIVRGTEV